MPRGQKHVKILRKLHMKNLLDSMESAWNLTEYRGTSMEFE